MYVHYGSLAEWGLATEGTLWPVWPTLFLLMLWASIMIPRLSQRVLPARRVHDAQAIRVHPAGMSSLLQVRTQENTLEHRHVEHRQ